MSCNEDQDSTKMSGYDDSGDPDWFQPLRDQFPICAHAAYFQTGTLAPMARSVRQAVVGALEQEGDAALCGSAALADFFARAESARGHLSSFLGTTPEHIAWTGNTSLAIRYILNSITWQPGDRILLTDTEHVGTRNAIRALSEIAGVEPVVVRAGTNEDQFLTSLTEYLAVSDRTRLLFMSHVSCQDGRCLPIEGAIAFAHAAGIPVAIDGAQSAGQLPVDLDELSCDFFIGSGHKWLLGPHGTGYVYARNVAAFAPSFSLVPDNLLQVQRVNDAANPLMKPLVEIGTESVALKIGIDAAITLLETVDLARAHDHVCRLSLLLRDGLTQIPSIHLVADGYARTMSGITAFVVDDVEVSSLRRLTDDLWQRAGVVVKTQLDSEAIRISVARFNSVEDVQHLLDAVPDSLARARSL